MISIQPSVQVKVQKKINGPGYLKLFEGQFALKIGKNQSSRSIPLASREFVLSADAVAGFIHCPSERKLLMLRQFRYPVFARTKCAHRAWIYEAIAGVVLSGENLSDCFIREAYEETRLRINQKNLSYHSSYYVSPGMSTEQQHLFSATVEESIEPSNACGLEEEQEAIVAEWISYDQVVKLVKGCKDDQGRTHRIEDGKSLMILKHLGLS